MNKLIALYIIFPILLVACGNREGISEEKAEPILNDAHSFYILDPGTFEIVGVDNSNAKQFLLIADGNIEISCGNFAGSFMGDVEGTEHQLSSFSRATIENYNWLPGCHRYLLDAGEISIGENWFYTNTLLVRRDPDKSANLSNIQMLVHARELARFQDNIDMIVRLYYAVAGSDIYILTLSGLPEELAVKETEIAHLLANIRYSAMDILVQE